MCNCTSGLDAKLAESNTAVDWALMINPKTGKTIERVQIKVKKANPKNRKSPVILVPSHCPFCGEKLNNE